MFYEMKIGEYSINEIYFKLGLYKKVYVDWKSWKVQDVYADGDYERQYAPLGYHVGYSEEVNNLIGFISKKYEIYGVCPGCKMAQTFSVDTNACSLKQNDIVWGYADGEWDEEDFFDLSEYKIVEHIEKLVGENKYIHKQIHCPLCRQIFNMSFFIKFDQKKLSIEKIGQHPSFRDFNENYTNSFCNQLRKIDKEILKEYQQALSVFDAGYSVAAYVYIRRAIEKLITKIFETKEDKISRDEFNHKHFDEKVKYLIDDLPELLKKRTIYDISSAGIHSLTEEQCSEDFPILREALEWILVDYIKKMKEANLKKKLANDLQNINCKIKQNIQ